jgi:hypothetical protein
MTRRSPQSGSLRAARFALLASLLLPGVLMAADERGATIGMPARIDQLVLPGSELEVRPLDDRKTSIVLRITGVFPHGTAHRYDLVYYGLDPGTFDLRNYLRRKDSSSTDDLPPIQVKIDSVLPTGQIQPNPLELREAPSLGGYRVLLVVVGILWAIGLGAIILVGRRHRRRMREDRPLTLADRLRPLVERAMAGMLSQPERAELERLLLSYWRTRLNLVESKPPEGFALLRRHPEAGPLLTQLENWLHRPGLSEPVDLTALLEPYRHAALPQDGSRHAADGKVAAT